MKAVPYITTYCRKTGEQPINTQRIEQAQSEDNRENQIAEMWLQAYHEQDKERETKV